MVEIGDLNRTGRTLERYGQRDGISHRQSHNADRPVGEE